MQNAINQLRKLNLKIEKIFSISTTDTLLYKKSLEMYEINKLIITSFDFDNSSINQEIIEQSQELCKNYHIFLDTLTDYEKKYNLKTQTQSYFYNDLYKNKKITQGV